MKFFSMHTLTKGTYILTLSLETKQNIQIGKLGRFKFPSGYYVYVGSAFGPVDLSQANPSSQFRR